MTKPIEGVSEKILACAKEEFLEKGYSEASLRTIAAKADTTTGSRSIPDSGIRKDCLVPLWSRWQRD